MVGLPQSRCVIACNPDKLSADQDDQLDALAKAIARQRDLSLNISSELELHEDLLEETDRALD